MTAITIGRANWIAIALVVWVATTARYAAAQEPADPPEWLFQAVVMISGEFANGPTAGAGLVFGGDRKRVFVVTADHVVRRRSGEIARNLRVRFRSQQDSALPARFTGRADAKLDIAVLEVAGLEQRGVSYCEQPFDWLGQADALERGDAVYPLGHPNGMGWVMPVTSDRIVEVSGDTITFQSLFIAEGHSGGALLTEDEEVVGLIQAHQPPFGRARAIGTVLDTVKSWGYPVAVHRAGAAHGTLDPPGDLNGLRDLLIAGGCAIASELDDLGYTPLQEASTRGNRAAVALLLEHGADVNQRGTHRGHAPALSFATSHPDIVSLLLKAGANVDQTNGSGNTALFEAARNKSPESVRRLLAAGAQVNRANVWGETPLFLAVRRSDVESVRLLLGAGARVNVRTRDGETPLSLVEGGRSKEEQEMYKLLIAKGAVR